MNQQKNGGREQQHQDQQQPYQYREPDQEHQEQENPLGIGATMDPSSLRFRINRWLSFRLPRFFLYASLFAFAAAIVVTYFGMGTAITPPTYFCIIGLVFVLSALGMMQAQRMEMAVQQINALGMAQEDMIEIMQVVADKLGMVIGDSDGPFDPDAHPYRGQGPDWDQYRDTH